MASFWFIGFIGDTGSSFFWDLTGFRCLINEDENSSKLAEPSLTSERLMLESETMLLFTFEAD